MTQRFHMCFLSLNFTAIYLSILSAIWMHHFFKSTFIFLSHQFLYNFFFSLLSPYFYRQPQILCEIRQNTKAKWNEEGKSILTFSQRKRKRSVKLTLVIIFLVYVTRVSFYWKFCFGQLIVYVKCLCWTGLLRVRQVHLWKPTTSLLTKGHNEGWISCWKKIILGIDANLKPTSWICLFFPLPSDISQLKPLHIH